MKLLIIDDHPLTREGLAAWLQQAAPGTIVLQARDGAEGLRLAAAHADLTAVFLDLAMPGAGGMPVIGDFARRHPTVPVIMLSASEDRGDVQTALKTGASGYVPKTASRQTLLVALQVVLAGEQYVPPLVLGGAEGTAAAAPSAEGVEQLTPREIEVLRLLGRGYSNKAIARELDELSESTVKVHVTRIFRKLGVVNRTQAATAAQRSKLI